MPQLVLPNEKYKASFLEALDEYHHDTPPISLDLSFEKLRDHFNEYTDQLVAESQGLRLPPGYLPHTTFWLVEGNQYLGRVDIRHSLNEELRTIGGHIGYDIRPSQRKKGFGKLALKLGIAEAKKMDLSEVLITCDVTNFASAKVIQSNGGVLEDHFEVGNGKPAKSSVLDKSCIGLQ